MITSILRHLLNKFSATATVALVAFTVLAAPNTSQAASTSNLRALEIDNDSFWNYDFTEKQISRNKVDWPIGLLFRNDAEVDKVKQKLAWPAFGGKMYARMDNTNSPFWDEDGGVKQEICPVFSDKSALHFRLYADPDNGDRNWSPSLGYYVLGSAHFDRGECAGQTNERYGWSEFAERLVGSLYSVRGWTVYPNIWNMQNKERPRREGNHYWNNNGLATVINAD